MIYKKGTKVVFHSSVNFVGCDSQEQFTLEEDMTESELNELAYEAALESVEIDSWFELVEDGQDCD